MYIDINIFIDHDYSSCSAIPSFQDCIAFH